MGAATSGATATKPAGGAGAPNRQYGSTSTADALAEVNSGKHNSLEKYMDKDGKLTPEREQLHKEIIDKLLAGKEPVEGQATMTMLGGGPASGKSSVMSTDTSNDKHAVTVDPDAFKELLPGYKEMAAKSDQAAAYYHEESSALAKRFSEVAYKENYNVVYDGTADGSDASVLKKINAAKDNGYKVEAKYVSIDTDEAVKRNAARYNDAKAAGKNPRLVPDDVVRNTHRNCTDISVRLADQFDRIEVWDNNGARGSQKLIATGGNGKGLKAEPGQERAFNNYLNKGRGGSAAFRTASDGTVSRD
jgi:predicted ABC-type ATPase